MPDAIDARLASLTLSGVDIGEFSSRKKGVRRALAGEGVTETTVEAVARAASHEMSTSTRPMPAATPRTAIR